MISGLEIAVAIPALIKAIGELIIGTRQLVGSIPKCQALLDSLDTLQYVLRQALKEFELSQASIGDRDLRFTKDTLLQCVRDCDKTCKDYDTLLAKILKSKIRPLLWKVSRMDLKDIASRLESNKTTLLICLNTVSQERARLTSRGEAKDKDGLQSDASSFNSKLQSRTISCRSGSLKSVATLEPPPYSEFINSSASTQSLQSSHNNCKSDCYHCEEIQAEKRHASGLTHLCPSDCRHCSREKFRTQEKAHKQGNLCNEPNCYHCEEIQAGKRHANGLTHLCPSDCRHCNREKFRVEEKAHKEGKVCKKPNCYHCEEIQAEKRHANGLNYLCPTDCRHCSREKFWANNALHK